METKIVQCISCFKMVEIKLMAYAGEGSGHIAICPVCGKLAYNGK